MRYLLDSCNYSHVIHHFIIIIHYLLNFSLNHSNVLKDFIPWNNPSRTSSVTPVARFKEVPLLKSKLSFFKHPTFLKLFPNRSSPVFGITQLFSLLKIHCESYSYSSSWRSNVCKDLRQWVFNILKNFSSTESWGLSKKAFPLKINSYSYLLRLI